MNNEERKELLQYLKDAIQQESDIITQEKIITDYDESSNQRKPQMPEKEVIDAPNFVSAEKFTDTIYFWIWFFCWIVAICLIPVGFSSMSISEWEQRIINEYNEAASYSKHLYIDDYKTIMSTINVGKIMCIIGGILFVVGAILLLHYIVHKKGIEKENIQLRQNWNRNTEDANRRYNDELQRYNALLSQWATGNSTMHAMLDTSLEKSKRQLIFFYSKDKIYPKYHNLPALTSIYEYFLTGRCDELTGPHGAYNLYEDEVRKDTVISQMNTIIANLEAIRNNQYMLYEQVRGIQQTTNRIGQELMQIKGLTFEIAALTELNTYYAALNERNTSITATYHLLS